MMQLCLRKAWVLVAGALVLCPSLSFGQAENRPVVAVLAFQTSDLSSSEAMLFIDYFTVALAETGRYRVIDRRNREMKLAEAKFSPKDCLDEKCQLQIGRLLGADQIIAGSLGKLGSRFTLAAKRVEVSSGETLQHLSGRYVSLDELADDCRPLAAKFAGMEAPRASAGPSIPPAPDSRAPSETAFAITWDDPSRGRKLLEPIAQPSLPSQARQGDRWRVVVDFTLMPNGAVSRVDTLTSSGNTEVDIAVIAAVRRWRFAPVRSPDSVRGQVLYTISPR